MSTQTSKSEQLPPYWAPRSAMFEDLYSKQMDRFRSLRKPIVVHRVKRILSVSDEVRDVQCTGHFTRPIDILPVACANPAEADTHRSRLVAHSEESTPQRVSSTIGNKVVVVARINGDTLWDLTRPLEASIESLEFIYWCDAASASEDAGASQSDVDELDEDTQNLARHVFWHSSAHMLGYAMEKILEPCQLHHGPALDAVFSRKAVSEEEKAPMQSTESIARTPEDRAAFLRTMCAQYGKADKIVTGGGFFYEASVSQAIKEGVDFNRLQKQIGSIQRENHPFQRLVVTQSEAQLLFADNPLKQKWIAKSAETEGESCVFTAYRCGEFIDLCRGPHVISTGVVRKVILTKVGGVQAAHTDSASTKESTTACLQRVYGISFPTNALAKVFSEHIERASTQLDHKNVGIAQNLFHTAVDMACPGSAFFLPHGTRIYNALLSFLRKEYAKRGYEEVITANIYDQKLWMTSGHWDKYRENLFLIASEKTSDAASTADESSKKELVSSMALKPMNCPGHCVLYSLSAHSYKSLPLRYAEFGVLHRNEVRGALRGLTRVTRFVQDDAHIFCTPYQLHGEIGRNLSFLGFVYEKVLGFTDYKLMLSTKPSDKMYIGDDDIWQLAESKLQSALNSFCFAHVARAVGVLRGQSSPVEHDGHWPVFGSRREGEIQGDSMQAFWQSYGFETTEYTGTEDNIQNVIALRRAIRDQLKSAAESSGEIESPIARFVKDLVADARAVELLKALFETKLWVLNEGEGAFYGPKIDVEVCDSMGRSHQLGTTQLDFNLPQRFDLKYAEKAKDSASQSDVNRPIMVHRAILGSIERCVGILTEHYDGGKSWPLWMSPRQIMVVPISKHHFEYAAKVQRVLKFPELFHSQEAFVSAASDEADIDLNRCALDDGEFADSPGFYCDVDLTDNKLDKKIRNAQQSYYNFILVVGREEAENGCVNVRSRENKQLGMKTVGEVIQKLHKLRKEFWRSQSVPGWE
ncbi:threonyl-tRNA synthetase [Perkinsela sp. CCAP 1560/4]|nr:threonyl-tRNA synthetase [Perkinsela sp. CCAP 1560/4]|eukprot:KNH07464.1 threonyl-tRNA synthetase [Perkinsela sp. CCAP 1560/4]